MSYRGRPSRGCKRCVSKKVKCDQTHPNCQRCQKAGQVCEYKDEFELIHRNQTKTAEKTAKDKWRQRSTKQGSPESTESPTSTTSSTPPSVSSRSSPFSARSSPEIAISPTYDGEGLIISPMSTKVAVRPSFHQMAYLRFFYDFVNAQDYNMTKTGAFDPLPEMFKKSSPNSCFHSAVSAVSFANFGGRFKSDEARQKGQVYYGKALGGFAKAMAAPDGGLGTEEAMLAIFLLGMYEMLTSPSLDGTYKTHQMGAASIFHGRWNKGKLNDAFKNRYLGVVYTQVLMHCLNDAVMPPPIDDSWRIFPGSARDELTHLMHKTAIVRFQFRLLGDLVHEQPPSWPFEVPEDVTAGLEPETLLEEALALDSRLEQWWKDQLAGRTLRAIDINPSNRPQWARELFRLPGAPAQMHLYSSPLTALAADLYRGTRLHLNLSILRCARNLAIGSPRVDEVMLYHEQVAETTMTLILELIDEICMSIPTMFQMTPQGGAADPSTPDELYGFRALLIFWPFIAASYCLMDEDVKEHDIALRRLWIPCVFAFMKSNMGLVKAEAYLKKAPMS